jgi:hypothetical protein
MASVIAALGRVMRLPPQRIPWSEGPSCAGDVVALDATPSVEGQAAADSETLDKYTGTGNWSKCIDGHVQRQPHSALRRRGIADCRQLGAHQALEFTAVAPLRNNWEATRSGASF